MTTYKVVLAKSARRELEALESSVVSLIFSKIDSLSTQPFHRGIKKIKGTERSLWRMRVGDYRVVFEIMPKEKIVDVVAIRHRSEAYR